MSANSRKPSKLPRGIRNNNPLNIRIGNVWLGEVAQPTDREFEQFVSMAYGIRAAFVLLRRYIRHYKLTTIREIVSRWAPSSENATSIYIANVAKWVGISADQPMKYEDEVTMAKLLLAMAHQETGQWLKEADVVKGYQMA